MATHCSILAWRVPRTEEPGGLQSIGSQTVDMTEASLHAGTGLILGKMGTMAEGMGQNSHEWHIQGDTPSISPLEGSVIS